MKEKQTYRRFNLISFLAILGCVGMLLFECIFIFELYDRIPLQPETPAVEQPAVEESVELLEPVESVKPAPVIKETPAAPAAVSPDEVPRAETEKAPARYEPAEPVTAPVG